MAGVTTGSLVNMVVQDAMGKEGYLNHVRQHWASGWHNVVMYVVMVLVLLYWLTPERSNS
jgi:hypothetical protein